MRLGLADVNRVKFEKRLKVWLIQKSLGQSTDNYLMMTRSAASQLRCKTTSFEESTRQLMLRSTVYDLVKMVLSLNNEKDVKFYALCGDSTDVLTHVSDEVFKTVIPIVLAKTTSLSYLSSKIVTNTDDLKDLYEKVKVPHREILTDLIGDERCPIDVFVDALNSITKDDKLVSIDYNIIKRLQEHLSNKTVVITLTGGVNANRESSAT